ncbi:hypothetical protein [Alkalimarinus coralli]|uniref:hypothetical protein n=1 Tax=Alkalimarinus coralli TaxID=2935863 RepID=UPI00202B7DC9|nr:hypothetical protein [Alkalimarinus coralli]
MICRAEIKKNAGFVLVSVLWLLVIMALAASAFSVWVDQSRSQASERQQQVRAQIKGSDIFAKVLYTYMTGERGVSGVPWPATEAKDRALQVLGFDSLEDFVSGAAPEAKARTAAGYMRMDGRVWDAGEGVRVIVQDRGGLIGLSSLSQRAVFTALAKQGGNKKMTERLQQTLYDYQDHNSYRRESGAEAHHYEKAGLPLPMNGYLRFPLQLRAVMNWTDALAGFSDASLLKTFKVDGGASVNANTASIDALRLVSSNQSMAEEIAAVSAKAPYKSIFDLPGDKSGGDDIPFSITMTGGFRFWWWHINDPVAHVYDVQFDSLESGRNTRIINWTTRVALPDELAKSPAVEIDHPFFH